MDQFPACSKTRQLTVWLHQKPRAARLFTCLEVTSSHAPNTRNFMTRGAHKGRQPGKKYNNPNLQLDKTPNVHLQYTESDATAERIMSVISYTLASRFEISDTFQVAGEGSQTSFKL
jgi:hypothetical protein